MKMTRAIDCGLDIVSGNGFTIGTNFAAFAITYSPTGVTIWGNALNTLTFLLPNSTEFSALYDTIRIDKVELTFSNILQDASASASGRQPRFIICNDYNDALATGISQIFQQDGITTFVGQQNQPFRWTVRPKYQRLLYYTAATSSYEPARGFVNSDTDIPHYGTKIGIRDVVNITGGRVLMMFKFYMTCKNVK